MMEFIDSIIMHIPSMGILGGLAACGFIIVESIFPVIPLFAFITINFLIFGSLLGFVLSWIFTILGCIISYMIFKYGFGNKFDNLTKDKEKINNYKKLFKDISFSELTLLIAIPFTPAFAINIAAGLVKMDFNKYLFSLLIGKVALVYFWGYVGTSFIESISNPILLVKIICIVLCTYIISLVINKVLKIK